MRALCLVLCFLTCAVEAAAQTEVTFATEDGGTIHAHLYGKSEKAVVLAHGGRFNKESWKPQAEELVKAGYRVLALDFRGYGKSRGPGDGDILGAPIHLDVLAAARYLRAEGAKQIFAVGASLGGGAVSRAAMVRGAGIERLVLLAGVTEGPVQGMQGRKLFLMAREDASGAGPRLPGFRKQFEKTPGPKELLILEGSEHAQFLFATPQGERVMREIVRFLGAP